MELITAPIPAELRTPVGNLPIQAVFSYDTDDPCAIYLAMAATRWNPVTTEWEDEGATWVFARDLVDNALAIGPSGEGDVRITYLDEADELVVELRDDLDQFRAVHLSAEPVIQLMIKAIQATPSDAEAMDVDTVLSQILTQAGA